MDCTVFTILSQANHDYTPAHKYGDVNFLFPLGVNITNVDIIKASARKWLDDFDFETDYFLPIGNPVIVAIVSIVMAEEMDRRGEVFLKMLEWDKGSQSYVVRTYEYDGDENAD